MTKYTHVLLLFFALTAFSQQETLGITFKDKHILEVDHFIGFDNFNYSYTVKNNTLTKSNGKTEYVYNNMQLGNVHTVDITNALKVVVFYKDQNSVVILDNTLSEIKLINFNQATQFRKITSATIAYENNIWIYNELNQELELYNYIDNKTILKTLPLNEIVITVKSNFNYSWVVTEDKLLCYNVYGSEVNQIDVENIEQISLYKNNLIFKKEQKLFYLNNKNEMTPLTLPELNIKDFSLNHQTLYLYDGKFIYHYKLIK